MAGDLLIDLGDEWGHVLPLSLLEQIKHIETMPDGRMAFSCTISEAGKTKRFLSRNSFDSDGQKTQKQRLLGFVNGLIGRADLAEVIEGMKHQTGMEIEEVFNNPSYDISMVRQLWATHRGEPYFRFNLQFDPEEGKILVSEDHNEEFEAIPTEWIDASVLANKSDDERALLFVYEVVYRMVENILPEGEGGAFVDPFADVPVMGGPQGGATTRIDLANISDQSVIFTADRKNSK